MGISPPRRTTYPSLCLHTLSTPGFILPSSLVIPGLQRPELSGVTTAIFPAFSRNRKGSFRSLNPETLFIFSRPCPVLASADSLPFLQSLCYKLISTRPAVIYRSPLVTCGGSGARTPGSPSIYIWYSLVPPLFSFWYFVFGAGSRRTSLRAP